MERELVLKVMKEAGKPIAAGEVATLSGLDRKVVDKVFAELKKDGSIISPVRCKWTPAQQNWFIEEVNIKSPADIPVTPACLWQAPPSRGWHVTCIFCRTFYYSTVSDSDYL